MKIISYTLLITFLTINLYAEKNWIKIESNTKSDVDISKKKPINKMMQNITVLKQLVDGIKKERKITANDKKWFVLNEENTK